MHKDYVPHYKFISRLVYTTTEFFKKGVQEIVLELQDKHTDDERLEGYKLAFDFPTKSK